MSALEIHLSLRGVLLPPLSSGRGVCLSTESGRDTPDAVVVHIATYIAVL